MTYPDDADGQAIAEIAAAGVDLSQPLIIRFAIAVPNQSSAEASLHALAQNGYPGEIDFDEGEPDFDEAEDDPEEFGPMWTVYVEMVELLTYDNVIRIQNELDQLVEPHGGKCDGWEVAI
ncbi:ribonuclease E inhibitor RraB [Blastopirellula sp. JC732]|uniref:Ribonuclease E inhibitor RraB n=1 Tax=Blastopirellula sediminis TaxID=2894196 RepID=A0A9X1MIT5_9BACT|nr:ribonuclease E inhibitor RraB [Blastopirellula sediminis]MCC9608172.1 ribonuclease E inhibitor RraB [Blastopirellula sediminis]MCC9627035.1 ribonuclease E inhibitor RraB [Blastopirellula sediminis]